MLDRCRRRNFFLIPFFPQPSGWQYFSPEDKKDFLEGYKVCSQEPSRN